MVVVQGKGAVGEPLEKAVEKDQRVSSRTSSATNKWSDLESQPHRLASLNDAAGRTGIRKEDSGILDEFKERTQTIGHYANVASDFKLSEQPRQMFELHRRSRKDSIDSIDETFLPQIQRIFQSEYECMSSPESFSTSSSNRSSNTSSLHSNYTPDSVSLASFAGRINFGEGGKRCSQASTASQESGHRSWGKARDSLEFSDGSNKGFVRRSSSEPTYENTSILTQETLKKWNSHTNDMEDIPPPLPMRQCPPSMSSSGNSKTSKVEMIMPYKVVDLEELQKSLDCDEIDPYYIHDGSLSPENDTYSQSYSPCVDVHVPVVDPEPTIIFMAQDRDKKPALPPKRRSLSHSLSDTSFGSGGEGAKERPNSLSRQSIAFNDTALSPSSQARGQDQTSTDEESSPLVDSTMVRGRLARQQSLPVGRISRSRRNSASPQKTARPRRTAPPPPSQSMSPSNKGPLARPVSEMYPRPRRPNSCSPKPLKRSSTAAVLQSSFNQIQVEAINEKTLDSQNCGQDESVAMLNSLSSSQTTQTGLIENEKPAQAKEDSVKSLSVFFAKNNVFKKALISLKIPGTKKQAKKELIISPPTDFADLNKSRPTADCDNRGRKCVSFVDDDERDEKKMDAENIDEEDEQFYHNFPISHAIDNPENHLSPKKPPRTFPTSGLKDTVCHDGYLEPCTSQRTKDREDEINENKLPALGPLPSPPAESTSPVRDNAPTAVTVRQDIKGESESRKPATKAKPALPRRPQSLQLKRKSAMQLNEKLKDDGQNVALATDVTTPKTQQEPAKSNADHDDTTLGKTQRRSRSCEIINVDDTPDSYVSDMHVTVLKDIFLCWLKMLRKPAISLAGACWEDFEVVELDSWPKVSDSQGSVLQPVRLKKSFRSVGSLSCNRQFMAKIKSQTLSGNATKSCFDLDYSVCTSVESHENIASVLAYFRGDIRSPLLDPQNGISQVHTTISISEQVPSVTCEEFVAKSVESRGTDPYSYERTACLLVLQCLRGLNHLHEYGFTHGNLTLSNMFLIKRANDFQLFLGNFGRSQPLPKERRGSGLNHRSIAGDVPRPEPRKSQNRRSVENGAEGIQKPEPKILRKDVVASADIISAMLHSGLNCNDQNGNLVDVSKDRTCSAMFGFLEKASARLRDGTATLRQTVGLLQALLWGPFKSGENVCILSEGRTKQWLERQRAELIARLAMDEALSRTSKGEERARFSMEDFLFCEYLGGCDPNSLIRTAKCWFFET